jgi:hypothetical protein
MKVKRILPIVLACCLIWGVTGFCRADPKPPDSPVAYFPEKNYMFPPVVGGTVILHDFVVQNKGLAPSFIQKVKTD